jgi:hypothetical protein
VVQAVVETEQGFLLEQMVVQELSITALEVVVVTPLEETAVADWFGLGTSTSGVKWCQDNAVFNRKDGGKS